MRARLFASMKTGRFAYFSSSQWSVGSMLRSKSQNMTPSAKKFFVRSTCLGVMSRPSSARALRVVTGISWTLYALSEPSVSGLFAYPAFARLFGVNASAFTMTAPPGTRSPMFRLRAAGFIATSTSGASPGV
jgi:hypothetical protein